MFNPPAASAGKNLTTSKPSSIACSTSLGLAQPGVTGMLLSTQYLTTLGFKPGLTINLAPAATALSTCSVVRTVPAPTNILGNSLAIIRIHSSAASVRNVISAHGRPPSHNAFAKGAASAASSKAITGTIPIWEISFKTSFMIHSPLKS